MPLSSDDRKAFSLKIVSADQEVGVYEKAKSQMQAEGEKLIQLDNANKSLFGPVNTMIDRYHLEAQSLDGKLRTSIVEQDLIDSAYVRIQNHFYPNDTSITVPSLASTRNVWTKAKPFALTYAIGKNYTESNAFTANETTYISESLTLIASTSAYTQQELITGNTTTTSGQPPVPTTGPSAAIHAIKTNLVTQITGLKTILEYELTAIVNDDKNATIQAQNNAAIVNINTTILPAINTWLAYPDFASSAPTKLASTQLDALKTALLARQTFVATRMAQLATVLGNIAQDINTGEITSSSGLYGLRYGFLGLRLDILNGSLNKYINLQQGTGAQNAIISSIKQNKQTYMSVVPTSLLLAAGNDTALIQVADPSFLSVGDIVFIVAEGQQELQRAIKSINGRLVELNDIVPQKYKPVDKLRIYKDLT